MIDEQPAGQEKPENHKKQRLKPMQLQKAKTNRVDG